MHALGGSVDKLERAQVMIVHATGGLVEPFGVQPARIRALVGKLRVQLGALVAALDRLDEGRAYGERRCGSCKQPGHNRRSCRVMP